MIEHDTSSFRTAQAPLTLVNGRCAICARGTGAIRSWDCQGEKCLCAEKDEGEGRECNGRPLGPPLLSNCAGVRLALKGKIGLFGVCLRADRDVFTGSHSHGSGDQRSGSRDHYAAVSSMSGCSPSTRLAVDRMHIIRTQDGCAKPAVLGANDGILSTGAWRWGRTAHGNSPQRSDRGSAALVAGAMAMAGGDYTSLCTLRQTPNGRFCP